MVTGSNIRLSRRSLFGKELLGAAKNGCGEIVRRQE
jgi:hypothetical protein